ncbi:MAG: VanW family protein [Oscillospiraceae bacterium]|nr:VanW family protein [Oscillospiraceae bacterium]
MSGILKKIPTPVKMTVAILTPVIATVIALYLFGIQLKNTGNIYPNISVAGIDVSGLTREDAMRSLGLFAYEERSSAAKVSIAFPDDTKLVITGNDAGLQHNAYSVVSEAYLIGRGRGVFADTISFLLRHNADEVTFDIDFILNTTELKNKVTGFTDSYNNKLDSSDPVIYEDRIVFTKGAGHVNADGNEIYMLAHNGLLESLNTGNPVEISFSLPETNKISLDIMDAREKVLVEMVSSVYDLDSNSATECEIGIDFDAVEAARLLSNTESGKTAELPFVFTHPEYSQEHLESLLFRDLIAERRTYAQGTLNRLGNINLAASAIDGVVILSGEEFSFNKIVGPRTYERGYREAPAFNQGEIVSATGGGICQVSSTIYAAIRPSELKVTERRAHGLPVAYLPSGWDATVVWNFTDFRFVNNTDYPIRVDVELDGRNVTARIYGTIKDDFPRKADWND